MINARILVRKGLKADFDPTKMLPGEWAVSVDASTSNQIVWMCFAPGVCKRMGTYEDFQNMVYNATGQIIERYEDAFGSILEEVNTNAETVSANTDIVLVAKSDIINTYLPQIKSYVSNASASASEAKTYSENAKASASEADKSAEDAKKYSQNAFSTTPEGYEVLVEDVDLLKNSIIQTTERTLYGSNAGGIKLIGIGGASEQGENPSPDNPQEIESSGDIKNLLEVTATSQTVNGGTFTVNEDKSITVDGTFTATTTLEIGAFYAEENEKYILSGCPSGGSDGTYRLQYSDSVNFTHIDTGNGKEFTFDATTRGSAMIRIASGYTADNLLFKPMIRKADVQNAEYKPYGYSLGIKAEGKNLFTGWIIGENIDSTNGNFVTSVNACRSSLIKIDPTKTYFISGVICTDGSVGMGFSAYYDIDKKYIGRTGASAWKDKTLVEVPSNAKYVAITTYYNADSAPNFSPSKISSETQLEEGTTKTTFEPYRSKSITIPLNEPLREGDKIAVVDSVWGVLHGKGKEIVDGNTELCTHGTANGEYRYSIPSLVGKVVKASSNNEIEDILCTHYTAVTGADTWNEIQGVAVSSDGKVFIYDNDFNTSDTSLYKARLAENPITIEYPLATPIFEPFEDQTPFYGLESFDTVTYISTDSEVEPSIELKFAKTEGDAITLGNYNRTKLNEIHISELMALQTELAAALVAGSEV